MREGDIFAASFHRKKMEEHEQCAREEEERIMRGEVEEEGPKSRERVVWDGNGEPRAQHRWDWRWAKGICLL